MKPLLRMFQFVFGCRHRHLSRVFTIKSGRIGSASTVDGNSTCLRACAHAVNAAQGRNPAEQSVSHARSVPLIRGRRCAILILPM